MLFALADRHNRDSRRWSLGLLLLAAVALTTIGYSGNEVIPTGTNVTSSPAPEVRVQAFPLAGVNERAPDFRTGTLAHGDFDLAEKAGKLL